MTRQFPYKKPMPYDLIREIVMSAALSAGQAAVVAHVAAHELGAAAYAIRAVMEASPKEKRETARKREWEWQRDMLPEQIRALVMDDALLRNDICWHVFTEPRKLSCIKSPRPQ